MREEGARTNPEEAEDEEFRGQRVDTRTQTTAGRMVSTLATRARVKIVGGQQMGIKNTFVCG